jgi:hypothetical protein
MAEPRIWGMAQVSRPNANDLFLNLLEQSHVDLETSEEHEQKLAEVSQEVRDRMVRCGNTKNMSSDQHAAHQQARYPGSLMR